MPPPHFNGQLENHDGWVEKLQQWFGGCDPTYRKANEARMILSTLPPWLKRIINTGVAEATQHTRTAPTLKESCTLWNTGSTNMTPQGPMNGGEPWPQGG